MDMLILKNVVCDIERSTKKMYYMYRTSTQPGLVRDFIGTPPNEYKVKFLVPPRGTHHEVLLYQPTVLYGTVLYCTHSFLLEIILLFCSALEKKGNDVKSFKFKYF